jgi:phospholipid/cholesterol/gamma-HCH transport system substrate-binding protein
MCIRDRSKPVLDSQTETSDSIQAWAAHLATATSQLKINDTDVQGLLQHGGAAIGEARQLLDRLQVTLPIVLANLVSVNEVAVTYRDNLEQILVLLPIVEGDVQAALTASANTKQGYVGISFGANLNLNLPPPCSTGFLPAQQRRSHADVDYPPRPEGNFYCRVPQDTPIALRGARNYPCMTRPGKRAATVKLCESEKDYVPLNDGYNWKGDANATLSGQSVPELDPGEEAPAQNPSSSDRSQPIAVAPYDPATGEYVGPDGRVYTQSDLAQTTNGGTWQSMLTPPTGN